uniref:Isochorismatase-like domain-containing protein n=1 Tax=Macaca fascicularis TaxID=9541 RepID=A0A7N9ID00_MACFA
EESSGLTQCPSATPRKWRLPGPSWAESFQDPLSCSCVTCRRSSATTSPTSHRSSQWQPACSGYDLSPPPSDPGSRLSPPPSDPGSRLSPPDPGSRLSPPPSDPGSRLSPPPSDPGSRLSPPPSDPGSRLSPPPSDPGSRLSPPPSDPGSRFSPPPSDPGSRLSPPPSDPGSRLSPPPSDPGSRLSPPPSDPGSRFSPPPSDPGVQAQLFLLQTQESRPNSSSLRCRIQAQTSTLRPRIQAQPSTLRPRSPGPTLPPSDPGVQAQLFLPQTQESRPTSSSLRPRSPGITPLPSDPGVQAQLLLPQTQESRPSSSSLRPRSPGIALPPSDPGVQAQLLLPQTQESRHSPSSLRPRSPGPAPLPSDPDLSSPSLAQVARLLELPVLLTEQYPQGLGPTVPELGAEGLQPLTKTCFSMVPALQQELDSRPQLRSVLLCGIEAQACILNTTLDLLDRGLQVHVVVDACSSRSQVDRLVALARMRQSGAFLSTSEGLILQLVGDAAHPQFKEIQKLIKEPAPDSGLLGLFQGQRKLRPLHLFLPHPEHLHPCSLNLLLPTSFSSSSPISSILPSSPPSAVLPSEPALSSQPPDHGS